MLTPHPKALDVAHTTCIISSNNHLLGLSILASKLALQGIWRTTIIRMYAYLGIVFTLLPWLTGFTEMVYVAVIVTFIVPIVNGMLVEISVVAWDSPGDVLSNSTEC